MSNASTYLGGGAAIKSIQRGTTTPTAVSTAVTISAVDVSRSVVRARDIRLAFVSTLFSQLYVALTDNTTLTVFELGYPNASEGTLSWEVVEYAAPVKSIQHVSRTMFSVAVDGYQDAAISAVDPAKSIVEFRGLYGQINGGRSAATCVITGALTSSTNLRVFNRGAATTPASSPTAHFTIVEFF